MKQQHFLPASKGVIKNAPTSVISDGAFQDSNNVRFGEGYIEKCKGNTLYTDQLNTRITHLGLFEPVGETPISIIFTTDSVYSLNNSTVTLTDIMPDIYSVETNGYISDKTINDEYVFTNGYNDIYVWNGVDTTASKLIGTYKPSAWVATTLYTLGDIVRPTDSKYNGFVYKCTTEGTSGSIEPTWETGNSAFPDGDCYWKLIGGLEIEGNSASSLRAKCIEEYKGFMVVANTEEDGTLYPQRVRWAQWNNKNIWHNNEDGSGLAGYVDITDGTDPVMNIKVLGEYLVIYKQNSVQIISYTGNESTTFERTVASTEVGLLAPRALIATPNMHVFIGRDNIYTFDLNTATPIGDPIRAEFFRILNPSKRDRIFGYYDKNFPEIIFVFHSNYNETDTPDKALVYNPKTQAWSFRDYKYSAVGKIVLSNDMTIDSMTMLIDEAQDAIDNALFQQNSAVTFLGDGNGNLFIEQGYTDFRGDYEGYVVTKTHSMNSPELLKRLMRVQFHLETMGDYPFIVQIGYSTNAESNITWTTPKELNLSTSNPPWVDCDITARYFVVKFGTKYNAQPFRVIGYTLFYNDRGVQ